MGIAAPPENRESFLLQWSDMKLRLIVVALTLCSLVAFGQEARKKMDPNKPAGEQFKNVQILKNLTTGQFMDCMRSLNTSLGVECSFCHVQDRSSDEKETKKMARTMFAMTNDINGKFFKGEREVRCYTCHKGVSHPVSTPPNATPGGGEKK